MDTVSLNMEAECPGLENPVLSDLTDLKQAFASPRRTFDGELTVPKFYAGKNVFVTGATGFMGKVLIEKLLRCCPDVNVIYCLIRPKNNQDIQQRISELTDSKVCAILSSCGCKQGS